MIGQTSFEPDWPSDAGARAPLVQHTDGSGTADVLANGKREQGLSAPGGPASAWGGASASAGGAGDDSQGSEPRTILLVEDDGLIRMNTSDMLQDAGHRVVEAASGEAAMRALATGDSIDVLLTDVNLPGMSGPTLAEHVRQLKPEIAVVFATGDSHFPGSDRAVVLMKPYDEASLARAIEAARPMKAEH